MLTPDKLEMVSPSSHCLLLIDADPAVHSSLGALLMREGRTIQDAYDGSEITGPLQYFRLVGYRPEKEATALVIGSERESWGGTDRPVLSVHLVKEGDSWKAESYKIVSCERLSKDGYTFPPYW